MNPFGGTQTTRGMRCVVMCGGRGSRFAGAAGHKSMAGVQGSPVLGHVIDYWRAYTDDFIFVVKTGKESVIDFVSGLPINARFVEPPALRGIADGLLCAEQLIDAPFMVALGDCFCRGTFDFSAAFDYGIGVQRNARPESVRRNYAVTLDAERIVAVEEKPQVVANEFCGMGFYFFQTGVFDHIRRTAPSRRTNELEITDVLQTIIGSGTPLRAVMFDGAYVNVNTPSELDVVAEALAAREGDAR